MADLPRAGGSVSLRPHVLHPPNPRRGYVAQIVLTDDAVVAVGGTAGDVTVLLSSDARHFHAAGRPSRGIRGVVARDGALLVVGEYGQIARSADEGQTWTAIPSEASACLFTAVHVDGTVWIGGDDGMLLRLEGDEVRRVDLGLGSTRISALAADGDALWILGFDGALRRFAAGALSEVFRGERALTDIVRTPAGTWVVTGDGGQIWRSDDGGASFARIAATVVEDLEAVDCTADGTVVVVGAGATALASTDDGRTFAAVGAGVTRTGLWSTCPFGDGVLVGGDRGLVLYLGPGEVPWADREDRFARDRPLDDVFRDGPDGFLGERLRAFVVARNPHLADPEPERRPAPDPAPEPEDPELQGADAWKGAAIAAVRGLWSGTTDDFEAVWGTPAPPDLVQFERDTAGANRWSTFRELRLDAALLGAPPPEDNLFEKLVLADQLNYLGTALPEVFAGVVCIGSLGNGDTYHYTVYGDDAPRTVQRWDHETHRFEDAFADSLGSLAYLSALCAAADDEAISAEIAAAGYAALRGRVAPSWHFSMDERDPDFESYEHPPEHQFTPFLYWRAVWIIRFFRQDSIIGVEDLPDSFVASLNPVLPEEHFGSRLDAARRLVPTALYALWRAYLFDEPGLAALLEVAHAHASRIVRDAARLVDELRGGRKVLGRIQDVPRLVERFRALDLDPRRAEARAAEAAEAQRLVEARRDELLAAFDALGGPEAEAFVWAHMAEAHVRPGLWERVLRDPARAEVRRGLTFLAEQGYSRLNSLYRDEQHAACAWVARHADATVQALLVGEALAPAGEPSPHDSWRILADLAHDLDPRALPPLRAVLAAVDLSEHDPDWTLRRVVEVVGLARDTGSASLLYAILSGVPAEGGFETSLKYDDFVGEVADALRRIGVAEGAEALVPFAASTALRMRDARLGAARALARLAPWLASEAMVTNLVEMTTSINDSDENSASLLAVARLGDGLDDGARARVLEVLQTCEPMASSYVEVQLARAVARRCLGEADVEVAPLLHRCLTEAGWKEEYTVRRRRFALEVLDLVALDDPSRLEPLLAHHHPELTAETLAALRRLGHDIPQPRSLTWFGAEDLDDDALVAAVADAELGGRHHAARQLAIRGEIGRAALEAAAREVAARVDGQAGASPTEADSRLLREAVRGLMALGPEADSTLRLFEALLRHPSRDVKAPVLRSPPHHPALADAMRVVAAEKWGWQESTARTWLEAVTR
jgi:photosystem II stability/assembly factor-like uncharacterized protein